MFPAVAARAGEGAPRAPLPLVVLAAVVAATAALPRAEGWIAALAVILLLGIPHGALDAEVARPLLLPRLGQFWFVAFAVPYLALSAGVLLAWRLAPGPVLAGFLALSVLHFGLEDAGPERPLEALARGGLPIALPVLVHPAATARILDVATLAPPGALPAWLAAAALAWTVLAAVVFVRLLVGARWRDAAEMAWLGLAFAFLPPLAALALYFVGLHAPRHVASLLRDPRLVGRLRDPATAVRRSLPVTVLTLLLGALLWPLFPGSPPERLLALTFQGLAALTLPHLLLGWLAARTDRGAG